MKINHKVIVFLLLLISSAIHAQTKLNQQGEALIDNLISQMTVNEKLGQLAQMRWSWGDSPQAAATQKLYKERVKQGTLGSFLGVHGVALTRELQRIAVEESRLKIPLLFAQDVIHGWRTIFPVPLAEAASWNPDLVGQSARVAAVEATSAGIHWTFAPMVDISRDPRWGRITEGSGEDPFLGSAMATARVKGFQGDDISAGNTLLACAKHFCAYGAAEGGRDYNIADMSLQTLFGIYLPPFKAAVDAGVETFMGAFNEVNGVPMHANDFLINKVLHQQWGFSGLLISDFTAVMELQRHGIAATPEDAGVLALNAGVDIDMESDIYAGELASAVTDNRVSEKVLNNAVARVLRLKYKLGLFDDPYRYHNLEREKENILTNEHRQVARNVARESIVLLKNDNHLLPLSKTIKNITVVGALAADNDAPLGAWRGQGRKEDVITVLQGIKEALPGARIGYEAAYDLPEFKNQDDIKDRIQKSVPETDVFILVLGETARMTGEASNRSSIELPGEQNKLAQILKRTGKPLVILLMNGRPLALSQIAHEMPVIVECWFLGVEMGHAVADVLFGDFNPSGKLPATFPRVTGQIPIYYNHKNTGRPPVEDDFFRSKYLDVPWTPQFPFGYGLGYSSFDISAPVPEKQVIHSGDKIVVSVHVKNTGKNDGQEVVQLYLRDEVRSITPPVKQLVAFNKIFLKSGESRSIQFVIQPDNLKFYDSNLNYKSEPGWFTIYSGADSENLKSSRFQLVN
ncbi:MAG: beta-glucosidase BglX [Calditrichaeota bacterium]|nr:beta-glucosidase BglX [Calditrichota bacterium]